MRSPDVTLVAPYPTAGQRHAGPSGVASYAANLAGALSQRGAVVDVVAPREPSAPDEPEHTTDGPVAVHRSFDRGPSAIPAATRAALATGAPVVHLQHELFLYGGPTSIPGLVPGLHHLRRRASAVVTLHHVVAPSSVDRAYLQVHRVRVPPRVARHAVDAVQRSIVSLADACVVHEASFSETIPGATVIGHGIEERATPAKDRARRQLGLDDRFVVLCFGFVSPYKGLEAVLEAGDLAGDAVHVVVAGGPHPRLALAGDGYADELQRRHPRARFTGWVPDAEVSAWHAAADVAVLAYPQPFASSGALALAVAHRTPTLVSAAMAACVGAGPGAVVSTEPAALAARLVHLASTPAALDAARAATDHLGVERQWPAIADAHLELYERVLP